MNAKPQTASIKCFGEFYLKLLIYQTSESIFAAVVVQNTAYN